MTNFENQRSGDREIDDVDRAGDDVDGFSDGLAEIFEASERGERILQFLQAMDLQVMGACRADERLKPLLKLNVSCDAVEDRLLAHLSQHFEPSEVGMLARCLCIPLVSIRVGKINKQGTLLCPTAIRGNLNLKLLPTSDLRISFTDDNGRTERLITLTSDSHCSDIAVEEIPSDTSGRSFLLKAPNGDMFYFWCSEKSKLLGNELLTKMKDLLKNKPSLAELTGISNTRLECFATHLRAYLGSSLSTTRAVSTASVSDTSDLFEFCRAAKSLASPSKPLRSRNNSSQSYQVSLSPRPGSFKEGSSRNLSSLKSACRERIRRNSFSAASPVTTDAYSSTSQITQTEDSTNEQLLVQNISDSPAKSSSQVTSLASSLLSPYYCWCPPVSSTLQYTISPPQLYSLSSIDSLPLPLPPLSSLLPVNRSSDMLTPPLEITDMPNLDFPPLLSRSSSQKIVTFTPLMCDPIVHIPVIDICSSGSGYLTTIPPLLPTLGNSLIPESDPDVEKGARETLRLLISGSTQTNPQLMDVLPSATGSRGLYSGVRDAGVLANSFANLELFSFDKLIGSDVGKKRDTSQGSAVGEVEKSDASRDGDFMSNFEDGSD